MALCGCAHRQYYYAPPPPPPPPQAYREVPPLIRLADDVGYHAGLDAGAHDAYAGGYHPKADRAFHETPGYNPNLGPFPPYRDEFRNAYLRGYDQGFRQR